ncbi:uncharacterized protein LOC120902206 isoform X1 [Anopheles arabiensis]|uniref:uncharacterized protein LOC120902206 isoform X1 n=1 Tax=Anopheles arabiensis TaxID=7173 RepID=UPI001AADDE3F|nr:uncharacterized protein LOC120902206 isoform X1 [Anopheles arabiensis]XP_040166700.1 uncharacterized protein LOC120902206 isoform X1 [Anopheles arabiensis]
MSPPDKSRNEESAPWKSSKGEGSSRDNGAPESNNDEGSSRRIGAPENALWRSNKGEGASRGSGSPERAPWRLDIDEGSCRGNGSPERAPWRRNKDEGSSRGNGSPETAPWRLNIDEGPIRSNGSPERAPWKSSKGVGSSRGNGSPENAPWRTNKDEGSSPRTGSQENAPWRTSKGEEWSRGNASPENAPWRTNKDEGSSPRTGSPENAPWRSPERTSWISSKGEGESRGSGSSERAPWKSSKGLGPSRDNGSPERAPWRTNKDEESSRGNGSPERAPWKSSKGEGTSRGSPDRYRHRNSDRYKKRHQSQNDRYGNRVWRRDSPYSRHSSHEQSRYGSHGSDEKRHHEDERSRTGSSGGGRGSAAYTGRRPWRERRSPGSSRPNRSRWGETSRTNAGKYSHNSRESSAEAFHFFFNQLMKYDKRESNQPQPERPMSFIDKLIADEAMRMLSKAASMQETTYLNVPFKQTEAAALASASADSAATESSKTESEKQADEETQASMRDAAVVNAADSALLQKSAEQVTKKLINQLTTMSKYDLKQIIDNPGGKYETALNRHAQNKLRAEVRKQLKTIGLNELGSASVDGDGSVEPDEAIDANKIPPALLAQIGQALDLDLEDLTHTDSEPFEQVADAAKDSQPVEGNGMLGPIFGTAVPWGTTNQEEMAESSNRTLTKVRVAHKPSPTTPGRKNQKSVPNGNAIICIDDAESPVVTIPPAKAKTPNRMKSPKGKGVNGKGGVQTVSTLKTVEGQINNNVATNIPQESSIRAAPKHKISPKERNRSKILKVQETPSAYINQLNTNSVMESNPPQVEPTRVEKNVPFLRISTVEELNRRLDDHEEAALIDKEQSADRTEQLASGGVGQLHSNGSTRLETNSDISLNVPLPSQTPTTANDDDSIQNQLNNSDQATDTAAAPATTTTATPTGQEQQQHSNIPIFQRLIERRKKRCKSAIEKHLEDILSKKGDTRIISEDGEVIVDRLRNNDYLAMVCPSLRKALPFAKVQLLPPKDVNRKRKNATTPVDTMPAEGQWQIETAPNMTNECSTNPPIVPDTHMGKVPKNKLRWNRWMQANSPDMICSREAAEKNGEPHSGASERISSVSSLSGEDQILNEAYDHYTSKTGEDGGGGEPGDGDDVITSEPVQASPNSSAEVNRPCIRVRSASISQEFSTPDTSFVEGVLNEDPEERPLAEATNHQCSSEPPASQQSAATLDSVSISNLPATEPIVDSKEDIERIPSPEPPLDTSTATEEYILGGDSEQKCVPMEMERYGDRSASQEQVQEQAQEQEQPATHRRVATPQPTQQPTRFQPLYEITERLQSIDAETMDLYNRKAQIDAMIMQLNSERMDINQQLVKLHHTRGEQMNDLRITLLELGMSDSPPGGTEVTNQSPTTCHASDVTRNADPVHHTVHQSAPPPAQPQQERTIRRITPIGGNSVLMKIFQRRRAPSERSTEDNPPPNDLA